MSAVVCMLLCSSALASAEDVVYVDASATGANGGTSWTDAFVDLADALAVATAGDDVWVAEGLYRPDRSSSALNPTPPTPGDPTATFALASGVALYGGFVGGEPSVAERAGSFDATILSGDLLGDDGPDFANTDDNSHHVLTATGVDATARVDGFAVVGGNASSPSRGGGLLVVGGAGPSVARCAFRDNQGGGTLGIGGGGAVHVAGSSPSFDACDFVGNTANVAGALSILEGSDPRVTDCTFDDNHADLSSGAVYCFDDCDPRFERCVFSRNTAERAGAMFVGGECAPLLSRCTFAFNRTSEVGDTTAGGAMRNNGSSPTLVSCVFVGNAAAPNDSPFNEPSRGGAVSNGGDVVALFVNCVFTRNSAELGGAIYNESDAAPTLVNCVVTGNDGTALVTAGTNGSFTVANCILWDNAGSSASVQANQVASPVLTIDHSCVQGWTGSLGGTGNIGLDPQFVDPSALGDFHLLASSPCIDAGDGVLLPADTADLDCDGDTLEPLPLDLDSFVRDVDASGVPGTSVDMGVFEFGAALPDERWTDLGSALAGMHGEPVLTGAGTLCAGEPVVVTLTGALESAQASLVVGFDVLDAPFKQGVLVPTPVIVLLGIRAGPTGATTIDSDWPSGLPAGFDVVLQFWIVDPAGPAGFSASNGLRATTP